MVILTSIFAALLARLRRIAVFAVLLTATWSVLALLHSAHAAVGLATIEANGEDGPVTLFYPSSSPAQAYASGSFTLHVAPQGTPVKGNRRLVVISHGSGASPWVYSDSARTLAQAGFMVALPLHKGDNYQDPSRPGPRSWAQRPAEVSRAIDALGQDARFAPLLDLNKVGVYGMSAGGHTVLSLAGGAWSRGNLMRHCEAHIQEDFNGCVGLMLQQTGGPLDSVKRWLALTVIRWRMNDDTPQTYDDPRIAAAVAGVPFAADFDMKTLVQPRIPLALITAGQDRWLIPKFHSDRVLAACATCVHLAHLPSAGHGALLSPLPPGLTGLAAQLINDPPGFDRAQMPAIDAKIRAFFVQHLVD
jgi:predicted dienelactone hydrolase